MQIINSGRGSGKTYALVQWLLEDPDHRMIITQSGDRARHIRCTYNLDANQVRALNPIETLRGTTRHIGFDDADTIIRQALYGAVNSTMEISIFTSSFDEHEPYDSSTPLQQAEFHERVAKYIRFSNSLPPLHPEPTASPEVTRLIELGDQLGSAVRDFLSKK